MMLEYLQLKEKTNCIRKASSNEGYKCSEEYLEYKKELRDLRTSLQLLYENFPYSYKDFKAFMNNRTNIGDEEILKFVLECLDIKYFA
jgi:DNA-binding ferritin-like protein (Dps family)